jgi:peptidoglycan/xylan/chitin deacetylase (PgdA/CDA1 family)
VIYLTFDAGYENGNVEKNLDVLKEEGIKGSFFILGNLIERNPELVKRMAEEGHLVCNHTVNHRNLTCADEEKFKAEDSMEKAAAKADKDAMKAAAKAEKLAAKEAAKAEKLAAKEAADKEQNK